MSGETTRCKGTSKKGKPCKAAATSSGYCYLHSDPTRASQIGREGGRRNRHFVESTARPLPALASSTGVRDAIASIIEDAYAGRVHPRKVAGLAPLLATLLRAVGAAELEERIKKLESKVAVLATKTPPKPGEGEEWDSA